MFDPDLPPLIRQRVLPRLQATSAVALAAGMSGGLVYRCQRGDGQSFALKRYPLGTAADRVAEIHWVIRASHAAGCSIVPALLPLQSAATSIAADGGHWEASWWMPGAPLPPDAAVADIAAGAAAIGWFHRSVRPLGMIRQSPPAVVTRLQRLQQLMAELPAALAADRTWLPMEWTEPIQAAAQLLHWKWDEVALQISRSLSPWAHRPLVVQYVLRDVHHQHLLQRQGIVTGIVDFDAVRIDTPATDLARWVGSFLLGRDDPQSIWHAALAGYSDECPFPLGTAEETAQLAQTLCGASTWISLANWLVWLLLERRCFDVPRNHVADRIVALTSLAVQYPEVV